jgi:predicted DsbA family dithiol-disulfide isomerase
MTIDIWSDVACPYCYIGKRHLEAALARFPQAETVQINWRSFELDPQAPTKSPGDLYDVLSRKYRMSRTQAQEMTQSVENMGREAGLDFEFGKAVPVNTLAAHRLIHLAAEQNLQDVAKEHLLKAYFTEGKDLSDSNTLVSIGVAIGLDAALVESTLQSDAFVESVRADEEMAHQLGVQGVPFFVFDQKYALRGAQPVDAFVQTLEAVCEKNQAEVTADGAACDVDGCD